MKCPFCNKEAIWCENKEIYGRNYGKSYMCYLCKDCDAYVGCHKNSKRPLGTMANKELRKWRNLAHKAFDPSWKNGNIKRKTAYKRLAEAFGVKEVHIAESNIETCKDIIKTCKLIFNSSN